MSTNFLEVGALREGLQEIQENAQWLARLLTMTTEQRVAMEQARVAQGDVTTYADDVRTALTAVLGQSRDLVELLDRFESDPIVYTGAGSTAEVLAMLERLLAGQKREAGHP